MRRAEAPSAREAVGSQPWHTRGKNNTDQTSGNSLRKEFEPEDRSFQKNSKRHAIAALRECQRATGLPISVGQLYCPAIIENMPLPRTEQGHAGGEPVDIILACDGAEFTLGEETSQRDSASHITDRARVVVRL